LLDNAAPASAAFRAGFMHSHVGDNFMVKQSAGTGTASGRTIRKWHRTRSKLRACQRHSLAQQLRQIACGQHKMRALARISHHLRHSLLRDKQHQPDHNAQVQKNSW
jgi:hypothetical protein